MLAPVSLPSWVQAGPPGTWTEGLDGLGYGGAEGRPAWCVQSLRGAEKGVLRARETEQWPQPLKL